MHLYAEHFAPTPESEAELERLRQLPAEALLRLYREGLNNWRDE